jgi:hypothetical protein
LEAKETVASLNLYQKLAKIRGIADVVKKGMKGYNYSYTDITEILAKVTAGMNKYGVSLIPSVVPGTASVQQVVTENTKFKKTGEEYISRTCEMMMSADMVYTWVNDENPDEKIVVPWFITGSQADPSQAFGSALTYKLRYFLTNYFQIAQSSTDVDAYRSKQKVAEEAEDTAIANGILEELDKLIKIYIAENPDSKDAVVDLVKKYEKKANYMAIKQPELAAKLLDDFRKTFMSKE